MLSEANSTLRELQADTAAAAPPTMSNPLYCILTGDSFMFTIGDPYHYPKYLKNSVLNTNPNFDYGAFINLEENMKKKQATTAKEDKSSPVLFTFTFLEKGAYVFADAENTQKMMMITVMGAGESCPDPEKYVKSMSGNTLSEFGAPQSDVGIIIKPDYGLLLSLAGILFLSTAVTMGVIAVGLHSEWKIRKVKREGYRLKNIDINISHE